MDDLAVCLRMWSNQVIDLATVNLSEIARICSGTEKEIELLVLIKSG